MRGLGVLLALVALLAAAAPLWLPLPGTLLAVAEPPAPADVGLLLEGSGADSLERVEEWRRSGLVREVVIVEAPVRTHGLVAYWSDFVGWGLARGSPTPAAHLRVVRSGSLAAAEQARAALPALAELRAGSVLLPGGQLGSRLSQREVAGVLGPAGVSVRLVALEPPRDPGRWYLDAEDRRSVLELWLELAFPFLQGGEEQAPLAAAGGW